MTTHESLLLLRKLDTQAREDPSRFRHHLRQWVAAAWAGITGLTLLPLLGMAFVFWQMKVQPVDRRPGAALALIGFLALFLAFLPHFLRLLRMRVLAPGGLEITRSMAPGLYRELDDLCRVAGTLPFDGVLLSGDFNASMSIGPRSGVRGLRRYLVLGQPLLQALTAEEMKAIVAHELAHQADRSPLARAMARLERWVELLGNRSHGVPGGLLDGPFAWFQPRFTARSLTFRRLLEFEADAFAAQLVSAKTLQSALTRMSVLVHRWQSMLAPGGPVLENGKALPKHITEIWRECLNSTLSEDTRCKVSQELVMDTSVLESHPSLKDRCRALGLEHSTSVLHPVEESAAQSWFGEHWLEMAQKYDEWWMATLRQSFRQATLCMSEAESSLQETMGSEPRKGAADREEWLLNMVELTEEARGSKAAQIPLEQLLAEFPGNLTARVMKVSALLKEDDPAGVELLKRMPLSPLMAPLWGQAMRLCGRLGLTERETQAAICKDESIMRSFDAIPKATVMRPGETALPHSLTGGQADVLAEQAARLPSVTKLAVVRKELPDQPDMHFHLIVIGLASSKKLDRIEAVQGMQQVLPTSRLGRAECRMVVVPPLVWDIHRLFFSVPEAVLYDRDHAIR